MLAIEGGQPVRDHFLPYGQQWLDEEDIQAVIDTLKSPFITQGPKITEFEEKIADYAGAKYAIAFCNGTAALHAACYAAGIEKGDEVITTPITFVASSNAVLYTGGTPKFVDIDDRTYNIDPEKIEQAITPKTKAIIAVDFTGQPVEIDKIKDICDRHDLCFIEDAAHSLGASYNGRKVGQFADMTMFSFHPVKHITTGEGGIIVTNSKELANKLRLFRSHGITTENMSKNEGPWYYEMVDLGMNFRMTDIQAALGISQLNKLEKFVQLRRGIAESYNKAFTEFEGIIMPYQNPEAHSSWHLYMLRLDLDHFKVDRLKLFSALRAENIGVHVHYIPVHLQPYYQNLGYKKGLCPIAEKWYEEVITLPIFPKMTVSDVKSVISAVQKVLNFYRK